MSQRVFPEQWVLHGAPAPAKFIVVHNEETP